VVEIKAAASSEAVAIVLVCRAYSQGHGYLRNQLALTEGPQQDLPV
jgi:hypothetical protein